MFTRKSFKTVSSYEGTFIAYVQNFIIMDIVFAWKCTSNPDQYIITKFVVNFPKILLCKG